MMTADAVTSTIDIRPREVRGPWVKGFALDEHTLHSDYTGDGGPGHPTFDTRRSELGERLYRLKFKGDRSALKSIVDTTADFVRSCGFPVGLVVPVPPSNADRPVLAPVAVAEGLGARLGIPVCPDAVIKTRRTPELKNVRDRHERLALLEDAYRASETDLAGRKVLLIDDLYRSGATLSAVTNAVYEGGQADEVYAIVLTRTRRLR
jgi:predicted amidophosphoribosyltransferase